MISIIPEKNPDGRMIFHSTPRKRGLITSFLGAADDQSAPDLVGGFSSQLIQGHHTIGNPTTESIYVDLNTIENETFLNGGVVQWKDALNDTLTVETVPKVTAYSSGAATNFNLYGGYLIIPASGDGTITVAPEDMVLVQVPTNEFGDKSGAGYWDAEWNPTTNTFDNITANALGNGGFNMFGAEVVLDRFVNQLPMLGDHLLSLGTSDAAMVGHNMRIKVTVRTVGADHEWMWNGMFTGYRRKTV